GEMVTTPRRFLQAPVRGRFLQRLKEGHERRAVGGRQGLESVARAGALAPMQLDRLLERGRPPVVEEMLGAAQVEQRLRAEVRRGGAAGVMSGSAAGSTPAGIGLPPMSSSVGCWGFVTLISAANAPAVNSRRVGTKALRPNRPMRPSTKRLGRPFTPSWFWSPGSA